jgi:hypothetical protein
MFYRSLVFWRMSKVAAIREQDGYSRIVYVVLDQIFFPNSKKGPRRADGTNYETTYTSR